MFFFENFPFFKVCQLFVPKKPYGFENRVDLHLQNRTSTFGAQPGVKNAKNRIFPENQKIQVISFNLPCRSKKSVENSIFYSRLKLGHLRALFWLEKEKKYLNKYNKKLYLVLSPFLNKAERNWLRSSIY